MVINNTTTSISFFPFVSFGDADDVDVLIWHKQTKTLVEGTSAVAISGSKVTLSLPDLSAINAVAQNLDTLLIRVIYDGVMKWEYLVTYSNEPTGLNEQYKQWTEVEKTAPNWIKL